MVLLDEFHGFAAASDGSFPAIRSSDGSFAATVLTKLNLAQWCSSRVKNGFLKMKPEDIPLRTAQDLRPFYVDDLCILTDDKIDTPDGCWEKLRPDRGQGWGVAAETGWAGWMRTFVYKPSQPSDSNKNWFMVVLTVINADGYVKPLYSCNVFEAHGYNPRPKCVSLVSPGDVDTIQEDPVEVESLAKKLEAIANNPNLLPYAELHLDPAFAWHPSIGVDKNLRANVWKSGKFSRIKARCPDGREIYWPLCNHCGMVYKGSTLPATLEKHECGCSCRLAPNR